jgi:hypothetical protein
MNTLYEVNKVIKSYFSLFCASKFCINISCTLYIDLYFYFNSTKYFFAVESNQFNSRKAQSSKYRIKFEYYS